MRSLFTIAVVLAATLAACGKSPSTMTGDDDTMTPDAPGSTDPNGTPAFEVLTAPINLAPGDQETDCYYFHTSNTTPVFINKWVSEMTVGSHHGILFLNPGGNGGKADGTIDQDCSIGGQGTVWTYATQTPTAELDLPSDDGTGKPLAQLVPPNTAAFFQLHYLNQQDGPAMGQMHLKAYALPAGTAYTQTDAYVTYQFQISVPPNATNVKATGACPLPQGVKFWTLSTHSHKQSTATSISDGSTQLFSSTDWDHPGAMTWNTAPFYTFTSPKMSWECTYDNTTPPPAGNSNITVVQGQSASTNEMCMATGYYFPATGPKFEVADGAGICGDAP